MPGSSGFGNGRPGKSGSGAACIRHHGGRGEAGPLERRHGHVGRPPRGAPCTPPARRRRRAPAAPRRRGRRRPRSTSRPGWTSGLVERGQRDGGGGPDGVDPGGDLGVDGRHDLAPLPEVHLVPVVAPGVVAGRHHHAGRRTELGHGEGQHRRGHRVGHEVGGDAGAGEHRGGVGGEDVALVAGVVADDDAPLRRRRAGVEQPAGQAGGGAPHHDAVHPHRPGAQFRPRGRRCRTAGGPEPLGDRRRRHRRRGAPAARPGSRDRGRRRATPRRRRRTSIRRADEAATSGRAPTWAITSAAATDPRRPQSANERPCVSPYRKPAA